MDQLRGLGAEPISVEFGRTSLNPLEAWRAGRRLRETLRAIRPDVLIAYTIKPIVIGVPAARAAGVPRVVTLVTGLGYAFTGGRELLRRISRVSATILYRRAFAQADVVVFQNEDDRADFLRMRVLPQRTPTGLVNGSGVDIDHFEAHPAPAGASFLMMSRLVGDKGLREFAEASRRLKLLHPEVRISLLGQIDTEPHAISPAELEEFKRWGIEYHGQHWDVRPFIASHSVYVLPSYREGTPRSVLEALAVGRAIITTDAPGCRQTVKAGENGLLVPPRDADALLKAMLHLAENPHLIAPMGRASRRMAEEKFDVRKVNGRLLELAQL
jgi:glycosyltransferase involved in cell wall biosynthesis